MEITLLAAIPVLVVAILLVSFGAVCVFAHDEWHKRRAAHAAAVALARKREAADTVAAFCALVREALNKRK